MIQNSLRFTFLYSHVYRLQIQSGHIANHTLLIQEDGACACAFNNQSSLRDRIFGGSGGNINIIFSPPGNGSSSGGGGVEDPLDQVELSVDSDSDSDSDSDCKEAHSESHQPQSESFPSADDSSHFHDLVLMTNLENCWSTGGNRTQDSLLSESWALDVSSILI